MRKNSKRLLVFLSSLLVLYLILLIPDSTTTSFQAARQKPFEWNMDARWDSLEHYFSKARNLDDHTLDSLMELSVLKAENLLQALRQDTMLAANNSNLDLALDHYFTLSPLVAVKGNTDWYLNYYNSFRHHIKKQSQHWDLNESSQRNRMYTLMYGMRAAIEEVLLQADTINFNPVQSVTEEPSATPSALLQEIEVHSGDLLVSRGGAEVSAFISRGNDYPGNFSHVALVYVDEENHKPHFIEAHIEKGVAVASAEEYLKDRKLRFMVLRPRADLPQLLDDPMLPHRAAALALQQTNDRHIPYDFKMNFYDSSAMFCSEVGSFAYKTFGVKLWQAESTISSQGTADWLNAFGVENFVTQMPSDLEYDPQLSIVAEWCDPQTLLKDHIDNAVMDALLERANEGLTIDYNHWLLPVARLVKAFSIIQNRAGKPGIIPEGMSATQALKNNAFVDLYQEARTKTELDIEHFIKEKGYRPPYWQMVAFAREASVH
jgi:hypothetical protein